MARAAWLVLGGFTLVVTLKVPLVRDFLETAVLTLDEEDRLRDSAQLLKRARITGAPVLDGASLSGILSRNDLLRAIVQGIDQGVSASEFEKQIETVQEKAVWQVMASEPVTILPDVSLLGAARAMQEHKLNRLMVKAQFSAMLGILSSTDVVFKLLGCDEQVAAEVEKDDYCYSLFGGCETGFGGEIDMADNATPESCGIDTAVSAHMTTSLYVMRPSMCLRDAAGKRARKGSSAAATAAAGPTLSGTDVRAYGLSSFQGRGHACAARVSPTLTVFHAPVCSAAPCCPCHRRAGGGRRGPDRRRCITQRHSQGARKDSAGSRTGQRVRGGDSRARWRDGRECDEQLPDHNHAQHNVRPGAGFAHAEPRRVALVAPLIARRECVRAHVHAGCSKLPRFSRPRS